jgi:uncharacterized membrane protein
VADSLYERLAAIQRALEDLSARVERLEAGPGAQPAPPAPVQTAAPIWPPARPPAEQAPPRPRPAAPPRPQLDLEELLGGRVLAWVGGIAVVIGVVLFVGLAVNRGWIDEPTRIVLAFVGSTMLLAGGLYLYERKGQTEAAVAAVAAAIAALYATLAAATTLYDLFHPTAGLAVALLIGAVATGIAIRWDSWLIAALGIVGALLSPVLVGSDTSWAALGFVAVALLSATGVVLWRRWNWLASIAFVVSVPQLVAWLDAEYDEHLAVALAVLLGFWAVYVVAAVGYELRVPTQALRPASALLLLSNAALLSAAGWVMLDQTDHGDLATAWVLAAAGIHVLLGALSFRGRMSAQIAGELAAIGIGLSGVGLALALSGPALVVGWAAEAAILAWLGHRLGDWRPHLAGGVFLGLAAVHTVAFEAPPEVLRDGVDDLLDAVIAAAAVGAAAFFSADRYRREPPEWRLVFHGVAAAAAVYLPSIVIVDVTASAEAEPGQTPQVLLSAFWAITGLAGIVYGLVRDDVRLRIGGLVLLGIAVLKVFVYDLSELESIYRVLSFIAIGLLLLTGAYAYQRIRAQRR